VNKWESYKQISSLDEMMVQGVVVDDNAESLGDAMEGR